MQERFKAWVTRYALTDGIWIGEADSCAESPNVIGFNREKPLGILYVIGNDWHRTEEAAIKRAEEMRTRKIASLRKQIAKLEAMTFDKKAPRSTGA